MTAHANSHTHCQAAKAKAQTQAWQRVRLSQPTTDRQSERKKNTERTTAVWRNSGCSASYGSFVVGSSVVLRLNFCTKLKVSNSESATLPSPKTVACNKRKNKIY